MASANTHCNRRSVGRSGLFGFGIVAVLGLAVPYLAARADGGAIESSGHWIAYPAGWSPAPQRFRGADELVHEVEGSQPARIMVTVETRLSHEDALQRLREIAAEQDQPAHYLSIGGWPALQRRYAKAMEQPGAQPEDETAPLSLRVTTAVAAGTQLVRIEGFVPPGADAALADEIEAIAAGTRFDVAGDATSAESEVRSLVESPPLETPPPPAPAAPTGPDGPGQPAPTPSRPPPTVSSTEGGPGLVQRIQTGGTDSEVEIAVSNDGQDVVVANNSRNYATSNDGGQTFGTTGNAPAPPGGGANGDPSLAFGASGNFYFAYIGFPANGQCSTGVTSSNNNGQNFNFAGNATICDDAGVAGPSCFPDQEHIAADRTNLSVSGQDQVYSTWRNFSGGGCGPAGSPTAIAGPEIPTVVCSSDGGANWSASVPVGAMGDSYPRITVAQDGFVYVVYRAGANNITLNKFSSCDNGLVQQAGFPRTVAAGISRVTCPIPGIDRCNNGSDLSSQTVAVDDTNANHVYVSYAVNTSNGVNENVIVRDSLDGGVNWPAARAVTLNAGVNGRRFMPWVCTTNGTAYVTWYDMRNATAGQPDLADFFGGSASLDITNALVAGTEFQISTVSDPLCASGWPSAPRAQGDSESCVAQPQLAGNCTDTMGNTTGVRCDFSDCGGAGNGVGAACQCNIAASQTCNLGRGSPKYGDYNGSACGNGQLFAAWASATSPPGIVPASTDIDVFFETPLNDPPIADAGPDQVLECVLGGTATTLDGSGSSDPDGDPLTYTWTDAFVEGGGTVMGVMPMVTFPALGNYPVTLAVEDPVGFDDTDITLVSVVDTTSPSLVVPADVTEECAAHDGTPVDIGQATASDTCDASVTITNDAPAVYPLGQTIVTWTAMDDSGNTTQDTQLVTVVDTTPPDLSLSVAPSTLWPPNHRLYAIAADIVVSDVCDPDPAVRLVSITSNEPDNSTGDGNTTGDIQNADLGTDDRAFDLRAERRGNGDGRVYTVLYEAEDQSGNTTAADDAVAVPKSQKK